jgi:hypothetical protein
MKKINLILGTVFLLSMMSLSVFGVTYENVRNNSIGYNTLKIQYNKTLFYMTKYNTSINNEVDELSDFNNNVTIFGNTTYLNSNYGSWNFDGDGDYFEKEDSLVSGFPFSMIASFNTNSTSTGIIMSVSDKSKSATYFAILVNNDRNATIVARNSSDYISVDSNFSLTENTNYQIVGVFESANLRKLFVNGILVATDTVGVDYESGIDRFSIGRLGDSSPSGYFNGTIYQAILINDSLSDTDVLNIYSGNYDIFYNSGIILKNYTTLSERNETINTVTISTDISENLLNSGAQINAKLRYWTPAFGGNQTSNYKETSYQTLSDNVVYTIDDITNLTEDLNVSLIVQQTSTGMYTSYYSPTAISMLMSYVEAPKITGTTALIVRMIGVIIGVTIIAALGFAISTGNVSIPFMLGILVSSIIAIVTIAIIQGFL